MCVIFISTTNSTALVTTLAMLHTIIVTRLFTASNVETIGLAHAFISTSSSISLLIATCIEQTYNITTNYYSFISSKTDVILAGILSAILYINSFVNCGYKWDEEAGNDTQSDTHATTYLATDISCNGMVSKPIKTYTFYSTNSLRYSSMTQPTNSPLNLISILLSITPTNAPVMSAELLIITSSLALKISPNISCKKTTNEPYNNQSTNEKYVGIIVNEIEVNIEKCFYLYIHTHNHSPAICLILLLYLTLIINLIVETFVSVNKNIYIYISINIYNEHILLTNITHTPIFVQTPKPTPIPTPEPIIASIHTPIINITSSHTKSPTVTHRKTPITPINASRLSITYSPSIVAFDISSLAQYDAPAPELAISAPTYSCSIAQSISTAVSLMYNDTGLMGNWIYSISYNISRCHYMNRACLNDKQDIALIATDETIDSPTILCIILCICVFV